MKQLKKIKNQDGLSILEVLIAMLILSAALILLLNMTMVALDANDWSKNMTTATQLMQEKLEQVRNVPNLSSMHDGYDVIDGVSRKWRITAVSSHLRQVDVAVAWTDVMGRSKSNSISAFIKTDSI